MLKLPLQLRQYVSSFRFEFPRFTSSSFYLRQKTQTQKKMLTVQSNWVTSVFPRSLLKGHFTAEKQFGSRCRSRHVKFWARAAFRGQLPINQSQSTMYECFLSVKPEVGLTMVNRLDWLWSGSDSFIICQVCSIAFLLFWSYWKKRWH